MRSHEAPSARQTLEQRFAADRQLQGEIDNALSSLVAGVPFPVETRLARILCTVLEPSWSEHASFQEDVLFGILDGADAPAGALRGTLERLRREHVEIEALNRETADILNALVYGRPARGAGLKINLTKTLALRRRHHSAEGALEHLLPPELGVEDCARIDRWAATRTAPAFPINLILDAWD